MSDLIKEKIKKEIENIFITQTYELDKGDVDYAVNNISKFTKNFGDWIKCSDRLPELNPHVSDHCLFYDNVMGVIFHGVYCGKGIWCDREYYTNVTHWMPLPEKPRNF